MIWSIVYLSAVLAANYTAVWFVPLPVFGLVAVGTMVFGATFTARDHVHRHYGRRQIYMMILVASLASAALSVLGSVDWRIIVASVIAIMLAESVDTEVYQKLIKRHWLVRVGTSNLVSVPLDTVIFNAIAFAGLLAMPVLSQIIAGEIVVKFLVGAFVALGRWR